MRAPLKIALLVTSVVVAGCLNGESPFLVTPFDADLQPSVSATSSLVTTSNGTRAVRVKVEVGNPDTHPRTLSVAVLCPTVVHLYANADRQGTPDYAQEAQPGGCKSTVRVDTIVAKGVRTYEAEGIPVRTTTIPPFAALPPGRYYVAASFLAAKQWNGTTELSAGEVVLGP